MLFAGEWGLVIKQQPECVSSRDRVCWVLQAPLQEAENRRTET